METYCKGIGQGCKYGKLERRGEERKGKERKWCGRVEWGGSKEKSGRGQEIEAGKRRVEKEDKQQEILPSSISVKGMRKGRGRGKGERAW